MHDAPMIDPRPMEPPSYWQITPPNFIDWRIIRRAWNRETRKHDFTKIFGVCSPGEMLEIIARELNSDRPEFTLEIDATMAGFDRYYDEDFRSRYLKVKCPDFYRAGLCWAAEGEDLEGKREFGTDECDLIDLISYEMEQCRVFTVDIEYEDRTG
jgi:hypothetical protein